MAGIRQWMAGNMTSTLVKDTELHCSVCGVPVYRAKADFEIGKRSLSIGDVVRLDGSLTGTGDRVDQSPCCPNGRLWSRVTIRD